jgi:hypothetical protein
MIPFTIFTFSPIFFFDCFIIAAIFRRARASRNIDDYAAIKAAMPRRYAAAARLYAPQHYFISFSLA